MSWCLTKFKHSSDQKEEETNRTKLRNGKMLLEKLIVDFDGKCNPIRCNFSIKELKEAVQCYKAKKIATDERKDSADRDFNLFQGLHRDRGQISIVQYHDTKDCFNNIAFALQMNHKNILKLIGCSLDTQIPTLVFESAEHGTLADRLYGPCQSHFNPLLLTHRLKIAMEIANAVAYLHVGFPRPIVFRNIKPSNILFYEEFSVKLIDFSLSKSIPEGKTYINASTVGSSGFGAPEYLTAGHCNEKNDVYSFGTLLIVLLSGKNIAYLSNLETDDASYLRERLEKFIRRNGFDEIVDLVIITDRPCSSGKAEILQAFAELAFKCLSQSAEDRPTMVDVAKQLRQMYHSCV